MLHELCVIKGQWGAIEDTGNGLEGILGVGLQ